MKNYEYPRRVLVLIFIFLASPIILNSQKLLWIDSENENIIDRHVAFRSTFNLEKKTDVMIHISGASHYMLFVNGEFFTDGPDRYSPQKPVYQVRKVTLDKGKHTFAVHVHSLGVETRMLKAIDPFLYFEAFAGSNNIELEWKCSVLNGYLSGYKRISPQLGWLEWNETNKNPVGWMNPEFDDLNWSAPVQVERNVGDFDPSLISEVKNRNIPFTMIAEGPAANFYGYEKDDPSARFFLRDLECEEIPPQGIWKRYDLGRIRLIRPKFIMDLPEGTVVEFAFSEYLRHGRVMPWINLSLDDTYNLVHIEARGGKQEFFPLTPLAGRFVEVHIMAPSENISIIEENFIERNYYSKPEGSFFTSDPEINRIWELGTNTYLACSEDALVDNPTRERGQWLGDAVVGLHIGAVSFSDLKIIKNSLYHHAYNAREDGMVAGLSPGNVTYLSTFAALWTQVALDYYKITGDKSHLSDLFPYARRNIEAFESNMTENGVSNDAGWAFVDWGYVPNPGNSDMGLNLLYYNALLNMIEWSDVLSRKDDLAKYQDLADNMKSIINGWYEPFLTRQTVSWEDIGYHRTVLGLKYGFIPSDMKDQAIGYMKKHIMNCFPNNEKAPRLSDPNANNPMLITPYFAHYAFPLLIENGEMEFVLDQYRSSWGWMLEQNATTCLEVFDIRWSHCHGWAGCPTWQLSRYTLGLHPVLSESPDDFVFNLRKGNLKNADGMLPLPGGDRISVKWEQKEDKIYYHINASREILIQVPENRKYGLKKKYKIKGRKTLIIND